MHWSEIAERFAIFYAWILWDFEIDHIGNWGSSKLKMRFYDDYRSQVELVLIIAKWKGFMTEIWLISTEMEREREK